MKPFSFITVCLFLMASVSMTAQTFQKGDLVKTDGTPVSGRMSIDNLNKQVLLKIDNTISKINFDIIENVNFNDRTYVITTFDAEPILAYQLLDGKASLYHLGNENYKISNASESTPIFSIDSDQKRIAGILSVLFSDCNSIRSSIYKIDEFSERNLTALVSEYNQCEYTSYAPSENEIQKSNSFNTDEFRFYGGAGATISNRQFFNTDDTEGHTGVGLNIGVMASPSFLGSLQGNIYFSLEGSASFYGEKDFANNPNTTFKSQTYRLMLGTEIHFAKAGKIHPYIGIGIGGTSDTFDGSLNQNLFDITGGNTFFAPRAGVLLQLNNGKHLGLNATFIPEYENDLSFPVNGEFIPFKVNTSSLNISLNYYF